MKRARRMSLMLVGAVGVAALGACSVKASIGGDDTTTTTTKAPTTTEASPATTGSGSQTPPVGATEQIGEYTLTMVDPSEAGLSAPQGVTEVAAASITKGTQPIGLFIKYTVDGTVTDDQVREILTVAGNGAPVSEVTINGKKGFDVTLASGQVVIGRATEEGDIGLVIGVPGVTEDQLGQAVADVAS